MNMHKLYEFAEMYADGLITWDEFRLKVVTTIYSDDFQEAQMNELLTLLETGAALKAGRAKLVMEVSRG